MVFDTSKPNDLARLALVASDAGYAGVGLETGAPLAPYLDSGSLEIACPYASEIADSNYVVVATFDDEATGFKSVIFRNDATNDVIVSFAGTDGPNLKDWWGNTFYYGWNQWSLNAAPVLGYLDSLRDPDSPTVFTGKIHFTGQSLGGALAQYAIYQYIAQRKSIDANYVPSKLTLTTFNALGSVAALKENIGAAFNQDLISGIGAIAHYRTPNDIVSRLGEGHLGADVVYELPFRPGSINQLTNRLTEYDLITTHRIESGFYLNLRAADDWFAKARRTLPEFGYILIPNLQKMASYFGNPFNSVDTTTPGALIELSGAALFGAILAPANETNRLIWSLADSQFYANALSEDEYWRIRRTDWGKTAKLWAGVVTLVSPLALVTTWVGTVILGRLASGFGTSSGDAATTINSVYGPSATLLPVPDRSNAERDAQFTIVEARLREDSGSVLWSPGFVDNLDPEILARTLQSDGNWERQYLSYLYDVSARTNGARELKLAFLDEAIWEFVETAKDTSRKDESFRRDVGQAVGQFVRADVYPAIANLNPDVASQYPTLLSFGQASGYLELRKSIDVARAGLEDVAESVANLLSGTAEAAEVAHQFGEAKELIESAAQTVLVRQGRSPNPLSSPDFDPTAAISLGALSEGSVRTFTLYLPYDAGTGGQRVELTLAGSAADKLALLEHGNEVALGADGAFTLVVPEGRKELSFTLWASRDIDAAETLELTAQLTQLVGTEEVATHQKHVELDLALDGVEETTPVVGREIHGDWAPKPYVDSTTGATYYKYDDLGNIERLPGVASTGDVEPDQWLDGSSGNDLIVTGDFDEQAHGDAGDDFITGSDQSGNVLYGGSGNDRIEGGGWADHAAEFTQVDYLGRPMGLGDDRIYGGAGDDQIWGESEATQDALNDAATAPSGIAGDWLTGGSGADRIYGSAGDDVLLGGIGEDLLVGGAGMDVLLGDDDYQIRPTGNYWQVVHPNFGDATPGFGGFEVGLFPVVNATSTAPDLIWALSGDPEFAYYKSGGGADVLIGGGGSDILIGEYGNDTLYGGEGDDILAGWEGDDELVGGAGDDMMAGDFGRYEQTNQRTVPGTLLVQAGVMGTSAAYGSAPELIGNDLLDGGAGNDVLYGEGGDDSVLGGDGDDTLYGDADYLPETLHGNDILDGGAGDDVLYAGAGEDALYGGAGNDRLYGGAGNDRLEGGGGDDTLSGDQGDDTLRAGDGNDALYGGDGDDVIDALGGDDYVQTGAGNDIARGGFGADALEAWGEGNNLLDAGPGDDYVYEEGRTFVIGGLGDDWIELYGEASVIAFNPGDGDDNVYAAGAMTLSIGGGVQPDDLSLAQDGGDLVLDVAGAGSIRLTREFEADPAAWPEITLQLFGSVHLYDFNAAIGTEGPLGEVLAANETSSSETDGLGGAIAWQYAISGSTRALSDEELGSVLADPGFGTVSQPTGFKPPNRPPQLADPIADQSALEDSLFELSVAAAFTDPDAGDTLGFDAALADGSPLPAWLAFDGASGSFAGTPGNDDVGTLQIVVGASDGEGERAADAFALEVVNVNDAPTLVTPLANQSGQEGAALAFSFSGAFADVDAGDVLAYAATLSDGSALPQWLAFDPASQRFSAAPGYADGGSYLVRVTATDSAGASASGDFTLDILESEPPVEPGHDGHHGRHDEDHHHHHGRSHDHGHDHDGDDTHEKHKHHHDPIHDRLAKPPRFDFEAIARELDRGRPQHAPSQAEIRAGWERVARHAAALHAGGDDFEHGVAWHGGDLLRVAPDGGHAFGFDGSTGAARAQEGFTSFRGLSEGFRRLR